MSEVRRIRVLLRAIYRGPAWHGPSIREALDGVDAATAAAVSIPGVHSLWELVLHMTYWRRVATAAIDGGPVDEHPPEEDSFPLVVDVSAVAWARVLAGLEDSQTALLERLKAVEDERLGENIAGRDYSLYFLLHGVVQHDVYHLGQIAFLKKVQGR